MGFSVNKITLWIATFAKKLDRLAEKKSAVAQIQKNLNHLKWKLRDADPEVKEQLTCCLATSLLIYIGTLMVAAKV